MAPQNYYDALIAYRDEGGLDDLLQDRNKLNPENYECLVSSEESPRKQVSGAWFGGGQADQPSADLACIIGKKTHAVMLIGSIFLAIFYRDRTYSDQH